MNVLRHNLPKLEIYKMKRYISKLHIENFRAFKKLDVQFNSGFNFIIGPNGCGKTSILRSIIMCYSLNNSEDSRFGKNIKFWCDVSEENTIPTNVRSVHRIGTIPIFYNITKDTSSYRNTFHSIGQGYGLNPPINEIEVSDLRTTANSSNYSPLIIGAYRKVDYHLIQGMKRELEIAESIKKYLSSLPNYLNGSSSPDIKQWMINRYFIIEKDWAQEEKVNWEWLLEKLPLIAPQESKFKFSRIEKDLEPIFSINDTECYLEELSSAFQSILSIILTIFEWIESTNARENILVNKAFGTVMIDELDVHLHPQWQLIVSYGLKQIFPNLQFIVTTHSPHIIASADKNEVIIVPELSEEMDLKPTEKKFNGWTTDEILEEVMGVTNLVNKRYTLRN